MEHYVTAVWKGGDEMLTIANNLSAAGFAGFGPTIYELERPVERNMEQAVAEESPRFQKEDLAFADAVALRVNVVKRLLCVQVEQLAASLLVKQLKKTEFVRSYHSPDAPSRLLRQNEVNNSHFLQLSCALMARNQRILAVMVDNWFKSGSLFCQRRLTEPTDIHNAVVHLQTPFS